MNDVRELQASIPPPPLSPSRWPFAIAVERPFKMQHPLLLGDNYGRQKDSRRLRRCIRPPRRRWCREGGRDGGLRRKLGEGGGHGQRTIELAKIIKSFLLRRFPLFLSLLFARRM